MMGSRGSLAFIVAVALFAAVSCQLPFPATRSGYAVVFGDEEAPIQLQVYGDFSCPDTMAAFPGWIDTVNHFSGKVSLSFHGFPLPYHLAAFRLHQCGAVVQSKGGDDALREYIKTTYHPEIQPKFYNGNTTEPLNTPELIDLIYDTFKLDSLLSREELQKECSPSAPLDYATRTAWKAGAVRGVYGTPTSFLNGLNVGDFDSSWTLKDWKKIIDPLLSN